MSLSDQKRSQHLILRAKLLWALRQFFNREGFIELEPPCVVTSPGLEPQLDSIEIHAPLSHAHGGQSRHWLHTSPEYALKRYLGGEGIDVQRVYALTPCFRDEPPSRTHSPEFSMLEWYARDLTLFELMNQCERLILTLHTVAQAELGEEDKQSVAWLHPDRPFERLSVQEAFEKHAGIDLQSCSSVGLLREAAASAGIRASALEGTWDELYFQIFMDLIEPRLGQAHPTFLYGFPASQAALARLDPKDPRIALRFELFAAGHELANAFDELSDPVEQRSRFEHDLEIRAARNAQRPPLDEALLSRLSGLGHCVGIALGFDRLVMTLCGAQSIDEVRMQAWVDP